MRTHLCKIHTAHYDLLYINSLISKQGPGSLRFSVADTPWSLVVSPRRTGTEKWGHIVAPRRWVLMHWLKAQGLFHQRIEWLLRLLNGRKPEIAHPSNSQSPCKGWCASRNRSANQNALLWYSLPTFKWGFMHTFKGKAAHIYANYSRGEKRSILKNQQCSPHADRGKYFSNSSALVVIAGHLRFVAPHGQTFWRTWQQWWLRPEAL